MLDDKLENENLNQEQNPTPADDKQESLIPEPEKESFWKKYQEVIVTLVILVAIALGFYFYAKKSKPVEETEKDSTSSVQQLNIEEIGAVDEGQQTENNDESQQEDVAENKTDADSSEEETAPAETNQSTVAEEEQTEQPEAVTSTPAPEQIGDSLVETAEKGEGVTHLARRALQSYLNEKGGDKDITNEHKIYIEDYLKNKVGAKGLQIGEKISFNTSLIQEAIDASKNLNQNQLKNLEKYSKVVFN